MYTLMLYIITMLAGREAPAEPYATPPVIRTTTVTDPPPEKPDIKP